MDARSENIASTRISLTASLWCALSSLLLFVAGFSPLQKHSSHCIIVQHILIFVCHILRCFCGDTGSTLRRLSLGLGFIGFLSFLLTFGKGIISNTLSLFGFGTLSSSIFGGYLMLTRGLFCLLSFSLSICLSLLSSFFSSFVFLLFNLGLLFCFLGLKSLPFSFFCSLSS